MSYEEETMVPERQISTSLLIGTSEEQNKILEEQFNHECDMFCEEETMVPERQSSTSLLIGTSEEQNKILEEQKHEYNMSLKADISKEEEKQHKKRVQDARTSRVNPEPLNDYVTVKIRHPHLGVLCRRFEAHSLMSSVYDWAGSLNPDLVNFTLNDTLGFVLLPSVDVADKCTLTMVESLVGTPSLCSSDDEINFLGFGQVLNSSSTSSSSLFSELVGSHSGIQPPQESL
jgi:hypothetical protein